MRKTLRKNSFYQLISNQKNHLVKTKKNKRNAKKVKLGPEILIPQKKKEKNSLKL